ncbi:hypothetical protein OSB04_029199 [Centaurea solstitialis]|uniref:Reverse transcriptase domain-containing protein n=1 Tax=Centaurea solstitialis TaxID=347529 RepID=A0AA38T1Y7_9ASTR|nr:hypothetical protein OSB04_029199 [Centaurea solstitialis]
MEQHLKLTTSSGTPLKDLTWLLLNKAPGPDGFTFEFIRKFWTIVGKDFIEAVMFFESNSLINPGSNSSFITLVSKVNDPLSLLDYRPISLIGCITKVISKVLAERLKGVLDSIVSNSQTAFIKGRSILDGPLMISEILNWAKKKRKKLLIFKADFAKAFDSLNWNYLDNILMQMGFGTKWRSWVNGVIRTVKASVLINGSPTKEFFFEKGVRQGDPLAPFLFILAAEGLSVIMREAQRANLFKGVRFENSNEELSIFQFADDTIFLGDWTRENARNLIRVLKCFEVCSGLSINMTKSRLAGVSVSSEEINRLARWLRCNVESIPFLYLGLPVGGNMNLAKNWQPLIDKFKSKLSGWKAKSLSIGGRLCLCKSVLGSLGTYYFSLYKAPKKVIDTLEGLRRRFFWGGTNEVKKLSWVAWDNIIRGKESGGLGIGSLRAANIAMLAKWWWRERTETNANWRATVLNCRAELRAEGYSRSSHGVWSKIMGIEKDLSNIGINVNSLMHRNDADTRWVWELESSKIFSVHSLRVLIDAVSLPPAETKTEWIRWIPSKANILLWRVLIDRLATKDNLQKRGIALTSVVCSMCLSSDENLNHVMAHCSTTKIISAHLASWVDWWPAMETSAIDIWTKICAADCSFTCKEVRKVIAIDIGAYFSIFARGIENSRNGPDNNTLFNFYFYVNDDCQVILTGVTLKCLITLGVKSLIWAHSCKHKTTNVQQIIGMFLMSVPDSSRCICWRGLSQRLFQDVPFPFMSEHNHQIALPIKEIGTNELIFLEDGAERKIIIVLPTVFLRTINDLFLSPCASPTGFGISDGTPK